MTGRLYGVGVGPGDPELVTVKAARLIAAADVVAYHSARHGRSIARGIAAPVPAGRPDRGGAGLPGHHRAHRPPRRLPRARSTSSTPRPRSAWPATSTPAATSSCSPRATRSSTAPTCTCTSGSRTATRPTVVPGVTSISAASAALGQPLVERDEVLTVLPGTLPRAELARRLADTDSAAVLKLGRTFDTRPRRRRPTPAAPASTSSAPRWTGSAPPRSTTSTPPRCPTSRSPCSRARSPRRCPNRPSPGAVRPAAARSSSSAPARPGATG